MGTTSGRWLVGPRLARRCPSSPPTCAVSTSTLPPQAAEHAPRVFAIAAQYADVKTGRVADVDGLRKVIEGIKGPEAAKALPASGSVSVAQLSEMLSVPATQAPESGNTVGYAAKDTSGKLEPFAFDRPPLADDAVRVAIICCGMCQGEARKTLCSDPRHLPCVPW